MAPEAVVEGVAGAAAGVAALLATYPLKTIYTLQALSSSGSSTSPAAALSTLDIIRRYGLTGLYVGVEPNIVESALSSGVYFFLYSKLRTAVVDYQRKQQEKAGTASEAKSKDIGVLSSLLVATMAGIGNQLVTMPAAVVSTRMQAEMKKAKEGKSAGSSSVGGVISTILSESGMGGFWAGFFPSLILVSNPAIQYMLYEQLLRVVRQWKQKKADAAAGEGKKAAPVKLAAWEIFSVSALAKIGATIATYWLVVVKSRMQAASKGGQDNLGTFQLISSMYKNEGLGGFFKGLEAKILQTALNAAFMLMLKEQFYTTTKTILSTHPKQLLSLIKA